MPIPRTAPITWTQGDENELRALTERKALFTQRARGPLWNYVDGCLPRSIIQPGIGLNVEPQDGRINKLVDWMMTDAETIRDLLKPFDSGVRAAQPSTDRVHPDQ